MCSARFFYRPFYVKLEPLWLIIGKYLPEGVTLARKLYIFDERKC